MKVRGFENTGLSREQAESMTNLMTELLCNNKEKITESFVTKFAMEKVISVCLTLLYLESAGNVRVLVLLSYMTY